MVRDHSMEKTSPKHIPLKALIALLVLAAIPILIWTVVTQSTELRRYADDTLPTPTLTPDPTASPTPAPTGTEPTPTPTPGPSPYIFEIRLKFAGVTDESAQGAHVVVRFTNGALDLVTPVVSATHVSGGVYALEFSVPSAQLPPGEGYRISLKGEKHVARKFCKPTGQTSLCQPSESITLTAPASDTDVTTFDFTGLSLDPGDLHPQDGRADIADFTKIRTLLSVSNPTDDDKLVADLNYDSLINVLDAFWMRKTLETRYDE